MDTIKNKKDFRTLSGLMALMMLLLPIAAYARGYGGGGGGRGGGGGYGGGGGGGASSSRAEMSAPAERSWGGERMNSAPSRSFAEPQRRFEVSNWQGRSQEFSTSGQFSSPAARFEGPQTNGRFWSNANNVQRYNFSNRMWARTEPTFGQTQNYRGNVMRSDTSQFGRASQPTVTASNTATFGRNTNVQPAPAWNRGNTSYRVVNNVPASVAARNSAWRGSTGFFNHGNNRFIDVPRNDFVFFGRHHHFIHHRIIDQDFFFLAFFDFGPWYTYCPVYPYYHLGYVFVNPCGYWPYDYDYLRYYEYGCYPCNWYGYNPVPYEYGGDNYNYYTYNYYGTDTTGPANGSAVNNMSNYTPRQPAPETSADQYFDAGVKAFSDGDFKTALAKFALASKTAINDKVLPFAYSQAFLATGDYKAAAQVLRAAVAKVNPVNEGVFYPRGLYSSDEVLLKQIDELAAQVNQNNNDSDLQLLLGYQYLGLGELDKAEEPLNNASTDSMNGPTANALLQLLDKLQTTQTQTPPPVPPAETPNESK